MIGKLRLTICLILLSVFQATNTFANDSEKNISQPPPDNNKWFISVFYDDGYWSARLRYDFRNDPYLLKLANPNDDNSSWSHYNEYYANDPLQKFRIDAYKPDRYPTIYVQPPLNEKYGNPSTIVCVVKGYNGDSYKVWEFIKKEVEDYAKKNYNPNARPLIPRPNPSPSPSPSPNPPPSPRPDRTPPVPVIPTPSPDNLPPSPPPVPSPNDKSQDRIFSVDTLIDQILSIVKENLPLVIVLGLLILYFYWSYNRKYGKVTDNTEEDKKEDIERDLAEVLLALDKRIKELEEHLNRLTEKNKSLENEENKAVNNVEDINNKEG